MKKFKRFTIYISLVAVIFTANACEIFTVEAVDNPNALTPSSSDPEFFISSIQLGVRGFHGTVANTTADVVRMTHFFGPTYENGFDGTTFNGVWSTAYATIIEDANALIAVAEERNLPFHSGIAKVIKSYVISTLVDMFGDVPFTEANDPNNFSPKLDTGESIYDAAIALLDAAIVDISTPNAIKPANDLFYGGSVDRWVSLANTLKIRLLVNKRNVGNDPGAAIGAIVQSGSIIDQISEDFEFKYSNNFANPDSRHPDFGANYDAAPSEYISEDYMNRLFVDNDPRIRYYFYRQVKDYADATFQSKPCVGQSFPSHWPVNTPFCEIDDSGYWGRSHGDQSGIPPDNLLRTTWGLYPVGGKYDDNNTDNIADLGNQDAGGLGAGIEPIFLSSFTHFVLAEAALTTSFGGDARALLETGIRQSIAKVMGFGDQIGYNWTADELSVVPSAADVDAYVTTILGRYDAATSDSGRLSVIIGEYHKAAWGNGIEMYNAYRRTGFPSDLQPTVSPAPGPFMNSFIYPLDHVTRNANAEQKEFSELVFWAPTNVTLN